MPRSSACLPACTPPPAATPLIPRALLRRGPSGTKLAHRVCAAALPRVARELVDSVHNCDDLLMNYVTAELAAATERRSVLHMLPESGKEPRPANRTQPGISAAPDHFQKRARCITQFAALLGAWPEMPQWNISSQGLRSPAPREVVVDFTPFPSWGSTLGARENMTKTG